MIPVQEAKSIIQGELYQLGSEIVNYFSTLGYTVIGLSHQDIEICRLMIHQADLALTLRALRLQNLISILTPKGTGHIYAGKDMKQ